MTVVEEINWDPYDTEIDTEPYALWKRMRDEVPVYRNDRYDFWALSRFDDVQAAHRNPKVFISGKGTVLELMGTELGDITALIFSDAPEHDQLRGLVSRAFTPRRMGALDEGIRAVCREYLDPQVGGAGFDYLADFGAQLPSRVISMQMGVPDVDRPEILELIDGMFHIEPGVGTYNDTATAARESLVKYLVMQLQERRRTPQDDLLTVLVQAEIAGDGPVRRLSDGEAVFLANEIISAGTETVARLLGWAAVVLDSHPDQRAELASNPSLIPNAVEELLRFEAPSPVQGRWITEEVELHGQIIPKNSKVLLLTGAAGRDERAYPDAEHFDIHREFAQHVSFGFGIHFCLGAALARLEGRIALEETLARFPSWEVDHEKSVRLHTSTVRGYKSVAIRV